MMKIRIIYVPRTVVKKEKQQEELFEEMVSQFCIECLIL
jgi:hypothetical protein